MPTVLITQCLQRDFVDPIGPHRAQHEHLLRFGAHCIKGTPGARLVLEMDERAETAPNECIVDSITLNDVEAPAFASTSTGSAVRMAASRCASASSGCGPRRR